MSRVIVSSITAGPTRTAADTAVASPAESAIVLPSGYFKAGMSHRFTIAGKLTSVVTTPGVFTLIVKLGTVSAFTTGAVLLDTVATHTDMPFRCIIETTCRIIGASTTAKLIGAGVLYSENILGSPASPPKAGAVALLPWNTAPVVGTGFDSTVTNILTIHSTQTVATGSLTIEQYIVEEL